MQLIISWRTGDSTGVPKVFRRSRIVGAALDWLGIGVANLEQLTLAMLQTVVPNLTFSL